MAKRAKKEDFARVRAAIQKEMKSGLSFDEAAARASKDEPDAYARIVGSKDA